MGTYSILIPKILTKPTKLVDKKTGVLKVEQMIQIVHPDLFSPVQASLLLDGDAQPYEPGSYELAADSLEPGEYGRPAFRARIGKLIQKFDAKK